MSNQFVTIQEASIITNLSPNTIRRNLTNISEEINKTERRKVITKQKGKYLIEYSYLIKKYPEKTYIKQPLKEDSEELTELRETVKTYSIMLEAKDK